MLRKVTLTKLYCRAVSLHMNPELEFMSMAISNLPSYILLTNEKA